MVVFERKNPAFSLCGLNCCLCPRFNTDGASKCPGCGGTGFSSKHPTCAVATCNRNHDNVEYCFQCGAYPCQKYAQESGCDSFISYKGVARSFSEAKADLGKYEFDLAQRQSILKRLLDGFDDGRSKGLYCIVANDLPLNLLEQLIRSIEKIPAETDMGIKANLTRKEIRAVEVSLGIEFRLRRPH
jgi:hypothetical protein